MMNIHGMLHSDDLSKIDKSFKFKLFRLSINKVKKKNFIHRNINKFINKFK